VPIYWGCTEIGNYFNEHGMIIVDTVDEIIEKLNQLTPEVYERMLPVVEDNYQEGLKHYRYEDILKQAMLKCL
jgi:hypothetical protein